MGLRGRFLGTSRPAWVDGLNIAAGKQLDVRPMIARGEEPLRALVALSADIAVGDGFVIDAPFDPVPLRRMFERSGFDDYAEELAKGHWRVWFRRKAEAETASATPAAARIWHEADGWHIDVRGLAPPEPMLAVIALIETPATKGPVFVHHERDPVYLYPELAERGWTWTSIEGDPGEVRLRLDKEKT